jgi:hypothetical protein
MGFDMGEALDRSFEEWKRLMETPVARERVETFFRRRGREGPGERRGGASEAAG